MRRTNPKKALPCNLRNESEIYALKPGNFPLRLIVCDTSAHPYRSQYFYKGELSTVFIGTNWLELPLNTEDYLIQVQVGRETGKHRVLYVREKPRVVIFRGKVLAQLDLGLKSRIDLGNATQRIREEEIPKLNKQYK
jgi:hypothetical protein